MASVIGLLHGIFQPQLQQLQHPPVDDASRERAQQFQMANGPEDAKLARLGVFGATLAAFFLAEMGDKTQIATVALAAQYQAQLTVVARTTLGMLIANVPAVLLGGQLAERLPVRLVHLIAAAIFAVPGTATLLGAEVLFAL